MTLPTQTNTLYSADAPEIEVEHPFVHTGIGHETQLICIVHAEPSPQVIWYKDTTQLGVTEQHSQQVGERRNGHDVIANRGVVVHHLEHIMYLYMSLGGGTLGNAT